MAEVDNLVLNVAWLVRALEVETEVLILRCEITAMVNSDN